MKIDRNGRWLLAYILFIYLTLPLLPPVVTWIKGSFGLRPIAVLTPAMAAGLLIVLAVTLIRRGSPAAAAGKLLLPAMAGALVLWYKRANPVEQIHLLEYGLVGWLALMASGFPRDRRRRRPLAIWTLIALASGIMDELIQALLPNRVCDPTDMAVNVASVTLGMILAFTFHSGVVFPGRSSGDGLTTGPPSGYNPA